MKRSERGSNLVEFALVLPLLVLILAGMVDIGRAFNRYMVISNAAREGARAASRLSCYPADAVQRQLLKDRITVITKQETAGIVDPDGVPMANKLILTIDPDPIDTGCALGADEVQVTVSYPYATILGGVTGIGDFTMSSSTSMAKVGKTGE